MPYIRRLPSGKWSAVIRGADGNRHSFSHVHKRTVEKWAKEQEAMVLNGTWFDPDAGKITVTEWFEKTWWPARGGEATTQDKDLSRWQHHVKPKWGRWQMNGITRLDVQIWVEEQKKAGVGPDTIIGAYYLLSAMLRDATLQTPPVIPVSPCQHLDLPKLTRRRAKVYTGRQLDGILAELTFQWRVMLELDSYTGLRWGELAGIHDDQIDWGDDEDDGHGGGHDLAAGCKIVICRVATRKGIREWPKSDESNRWVPVPRHLRDDLWTLTADRKPGSIVFPAPEGGPIHDGNFRNRVWYPALLRVGLCPEHGKLKNPSIPQFRERHQVMVDCPVCEPVPFHPPRVLRHTAASLLLRAGVPKDEVKALLGHTTTKTTGIYAQFAPGELPQVEGAWERRRDAAEPRVTHSVDAADPRVTHGKEKDRQHAS